ncbi:IS1634 family transposase [Brevibacterium sp. VCM10]|uniref:IS1634 family transposase n=1 Tax=Brevibacterium sp. VCM10 TaxID=1381751 RepID=UPI0004BBC931|nr:IS1634 family transposase [Brevibacterium sp. VCM10]
MAWIRRVRTKSGATAVQIAESVGGRRRIVRHLGSARDEAELGLLIAQAEELLADDRQGTLDLGLTPTVAKSRMIPDPSPARLVTEQSDRQRPDRVPRARVIKSAANVLYEALADVYASLGFDVIDDDVFRDLVIARIVEPTSLLDADRVLADLGRTAASHSTRKRALRRAHTNAFRDLIATACFTHAATNGDVSLVLYDTTTLYFEAEKEDDLRKVGYSKERRVDPQIVVGLLVDRTGFPLEIGCYEGNQAETATIIPIVKAFQARHQLSDMVVVADAGMLSAANLHALDDAGLRFIVGSRLTKAPSDLATHFAWNGDHAEDGQIVDTVTPRGKRPLDPNRTDRRSEPVWTPEQFPHAWRAVWQYRRKRALRDEQTLNAQRNRAIDVIEGIRAQKSARFVKTKSGAKDFDEAAYTRAMTLSGWKGYVTNIERSIMPAAEVVESYHDLWHVERSFRMSKTDLRARPMFARTRDAIEAHLTIVFAALAVSRTVQDRTGMSIRRFLRILKPLRSAVVEINGTITTLPPALGDVETQLLDALKPQ